MKLQNMVILDFVVSRGRNKMNIKLADNDYLLLTPYEIKSETSLIVNSTDTKCLGKVAFDYLRDGLLSYKTGDIVIFDVREAQKYTINGKEYIIIQDTDVIGGIVEEDNNE